MSDLIRVTRLTPPGRGAVAVLRLECSHPSAATAIDAAFISASGLPASAAPPGRLLYGSWHGEDVIVVRTGTQIWEVQCHGGEAAVRRIAAEFSADGAAVAVPEDPLERFLLQAPTPRTARLIHAQMNGRLHDALVRLADSRTVDDMRRRLEMLLRFETAARHLIVPWQVVIAGPPNVGKSSLLNAVAGYERSIVFDQPGTTRDAVTTRLVLDGWPFCFADTAGMRSDAPDAVEARGIRHAQNLLQSADLVLSAFDQTVGWTSEHDRVVQHIPSGTPCIAVRCRADLPQRGPGPPDELGPVMVTSAAESTGIDALIERITAILIPDPPPPGTPLPLGGIADLCRILRRQIRTADDSVRCAAVLSDLLKMWPDPVEMTAADFERIFLDSAGGKSA